MTKTELQERFDRLTDVLHHSRDRGYFNLGQRTCLHRERAAIFHAQDQMYLDNVSDITPEYTIPPHLESKCRQVISDFNLNNNPK